MDGREKLVELLFKCTPKNIKLEWRGEKIEVAISQGNIADYLIAHGVTVQEWISVKEPPKKRGEYLCYFKYEPESPDVICQNTYYGSGRWMSETDKVTHWMPLPELTQPPKGE